MPVVRYFLFVGVALLAFLFAADAYLPKMPAVESPRATADLSVIRIHSVQKWPERIVIDTTLPTITPPTTAMRVVNIPPASLAERRRKDRCGRRWRKSSRPIRKGRRRGGNAERS